MIDVHMAVWHDQEATRAKHCGSALYSVCIVCMHFYWWSYLLYMVLCTYNWASLKVWMFSSSWSTAIFCVQLQSQSFPASVLLLMLLSLNYVFTENLVSLFHICHPQVSLYQWSETEVSGRLQLHRRIVVVVRPNWCHQCGMVDGVDLHKFCQW